MTALRRRVRGGESNADLSTRRLEAFTDGVFAIAATILILDVSVDEIGTVKSEAQLGQHLIETGPQLLSFLVSFLMIGVLWLIHVRQFEYVIRVDGLAMWLNTLRLLLVVLIPFTTSVNSDYSEFLLGRMLLPINFLLAVLVSTIQWWYLISPKRKLVEGMDERQRRTSRVGAVSALLLAAIVVVGAPWLGSAAFAIYLAAPLGDRLVDRLTPRGASVPEQREGSAGG